MVPPTYFTNVFTRLFRVQAIRRLGAVCVACGYDKDVRALCLDHVNGNGHLERSIQKFYRDVYAGRRQDIQVLCANCNVIKARENREERSRNPRRPPRPRRVVDTAADSVVY